MNIYHGLYALGSALTLSSIAISALTFLRLTSDEHRPAATTRLPLIVAAIILVIGAFLKGVTS